MFTFIWASAHIDLDIQNLFDGYPLPKGRVYLCYIFLFLYMYISEDSFNMMWCKHKIMFDIDDISVYAVYVYGYMA